LTLVQMLRGIAIAFRIEPLGMLFALVAFGAAIDGCGHRA
jgi:hypothetical protein